MNGFRFIDLSFIYYLSIIIVNNLLHNHFLPYHCSLLLTFVSFPASLLACTLLLPHISSIDCSTCGFYVLPHTMLLINIWSMNKALGRNNKNSSRRDLKVEKMKDWMTCSRGWKFEWVWQNLDLFDCWNLSLFRKGLGLFICSELGAVGNLGIFQC